MRKAYFLLLALLMISVPCRSVTIMKNVGHGDCYAVISDGRMIIIDAGPATSSEGLVSFLRHSYPHFDRIVITHVHSDHVGGLITAGQYARQSGSALSVDKLVSNHGEHDINVVLHEQTLKTLMSDLRAQPLVAIDDPASGTLAFADENIEVEQIVLSKPRGSKGENPSSLILKVTELRDGERRAVLFLGDIEKSQQAALLSRPDIKDVFRDVRAITLPHHGRPATLTRNFIKDVRKIAGPELILLHSDRLPLERGIAADAAKVGLIVKSTAVESGPSIVVDLFGKGKTFHVVKDPMTSLTALVAAEESNLIAENTGTVEEVVDAVTKFTRRSAEIALPPDTVISWPSRTWLQTEIAGRRAELSRETDHLLVQLQSSDAKESAAAESALASRRPKMTADQASRFERTLADVMARRRAKIFNQETERLLAELGAKDVQVSVAAEKMLSERRANLSDEQLHRFEESLQGFQRESDALVLQMQSLDTKEAVDAEAALASRRTRLTKEQLVRVDALSKANASRRQMESEILRGIERGWRIEQNPNIDENKLLVFRRKSGDDSDLRYVVKEVDYETWDVYRPGGLSEFGIATYGKKLGTIRRPADAEVVVRNLCEYCGRDSVGYCHMRNKYVCDDHRYFTRDGINWKCP